MLAPMQRGEKKKKKRTQRTNLCDSFDAINEPHYSGQFGDTHTILVDRSGGEAPHSITKFVERWSYGEEKQPENYYTVSGNMYRTSGAGILIRIIFAKINAARRYRTNELKILHHKLVSRLECVNMNRWVKRRGGGRNFHREIYAFTFRNGGNAFVERDLYKYEYLLHSYAC